MQPQLNKNLFFSVMLSVVLQQSEAAWFSTVTIRSPFIIVKLVEMELGCRNWVVYLHGFFFLFVCFFHYVTVTSYPFVPRILSLSAYTLFWICLFFLNKK